MARFSLIFVFGVYPLNKNSPQKVGSPDPFPPWVSPGFGWGLKMTTNTNGVEVVFSFPNNKFLLGFPLPVQVSSWT